MRKKKPFRFKPAASDKDNAVLMRIVGRADFSAAGLTHDAVPADGPERSVERASG